MVIWGSKTWHLGIIPRCKIPTGIQMPRYKKMAGVHTTLFVYNFVTNCPFLTVFEPNCWWGSSLSIGLWTGFNRFLSAQLWRVKVWAQNPQIHKVPGDRILRCKKKPLHTTIFELLDIWHSIVRTGFNGSLLTDLWAIKVVHPNSSEFENPIPVFGIFRQTLHVF